MTTAQIVILGILGIVYMYTLYKMNNNTQKEQTFDIFNFLAVASLFTLVIILTISQNKLLNKTSKCPEYERIDNVYKLKE